MASLARDLRKELENKAKEARRIAEAGARKALEQLGVSEASLPGHLSPDQRTLRNRLRAHARQLGERREPHGRQGIERLVTEVAYEHWHRMLFARFLAENDLLIDDGLALTLEDVRELAREQGMDWLDLAASYAQRMLPEIFRTDDPALAIALPPETRSALEDRLKALPAEVFKADDSLGWVYQFWQADKKDAVNKSGVKIGADELPAVTQLFTEDYMVLFLLHNTLGAWWAGKVLAGNPNVAETATNEAELRAACALPGVEWSYLRFVRETKEDGVEGPWRPAAGTFPGWPKAAKDITFLDPCMGSGHFLVFALPILVALRIAEEELDRQTAVLAVLQGNLHGLEIDPRCTQIAAFNLAFAAWRLLGGYVKLPALHLACSGLAIGVSKAEWLKLADKADQLVDPAAKRDLLEAETTLFNAGVDARIRAGLDRMYDLFAKAPWLGSLIDPRRADGDLFTADYDLLQPILKRALSDGSDEVAEMAVAAQGFAKAAELLAKRYVLVATNVPYLSRAKQHETLRDYIESNHYDARGDVATALMSRFGTQNERGGTSAIVIPQAWLHLGSYKNFRTSLFCKDLFSFIVSLGAKSFQTPMWDFNVCLMIISQSKPGSEHAISVVDISSIDRLSEKECSLSVGQIHLRRQESIRSNVDSRFSISETEATGKLLSDYVSCHQGLATGDLNQFGVLFWEVASLGSAWVPWLGTVSNSALYGGREALLLWENGEGKLHQYNEENKAVRKNTHLRGVHAFGRKGVIVTQMSKLPVSLYTGEHYNDNTTVLLPSDEKNLLAVWSFVSSQDYFISVRAIDSSLKVPANTLAKVPFDLARWQKVAAEKYPNGLPKPHSDDPTQWLFNGHPRGSEDPLQVAVARLVGYRWPRQTGSNFMDCPAITEPDGLEEHADADGIVCLSPVKGEAAAAERLTALLHDAYGADWKPAVLVALLDQHGQGAKDLDAYLRDRFFARHVELFQNRPFVWHVWDGRRDGFHALVNYHRMAAPDGESRRTLEKLVYTYLREWIDRQRADVKAGADGAEGRLAAAEHLRQQLDAILAGEPPFDLFVRWKPLHQQSIGWEPDVNDGVRMNIRPFMTARPLEAKKADACILRVTPRIKWDKDRGSEPVREKADYPWFWGWNGKISDFAGGDMFDGNRWNDLHYTLAAKRVARERKGRA